MNKQGLKAAVVIGKDEGQKLVECLKSVKDQVDLTVYVDSGSMDDSVAVAKEIGAIVVELDVTLPFTAARARNAGFLRLLEDGHDIAFVQFVDGDCILDRHWVGTAYTYLQMHPEAGVVFGRLRERFPQASVYNRLADAEWSTPVGAVKACGGIAAMRAGAFDGVGGFNPDVKAGEEPELCVRLRAKGWGIWCLDAEMALHDIDMTEFGQWWTRTRRAGYAYAQGVVMHGAGPERHKVPEMRRALLWGVVLPAVTLLGFMITPWMAVLLLVWPLQVLRLRMRGAFWAQAVFLTLGKFAEAWGISEYYLTRRHHSTSVLTEKYDAR